MIKIEDYRIKREDIVAYVIGKHKKYIGVNFFTRLPALDKFTIFFESIVERDNFLKTLDEIFFNE